MRRDLGHRRLAVGGLAHHGDAVGGVEDDAEPEAHQFLVVDDEHPDRGGGGHSAGSRAVTAKPPDWVGPTVRFPPHEATRSAIPARPKPDPAIRLPGLAALPFALRLRPGAARPGAARSRPR